MQAALIERDVFVNAPTGCGKSLPLCASFFLLEPLGKSSAEAPWVLVCSLVIALMQDQAKTLPHIADIVPVALLTEEV